MGGTSLRCGRIGLFVELGWFVAGVPQNAPASMDSRYLDATFYN